MNFKNKKAIVLAAILCAIFGVSILENNVIPSYIGGTGKDNGNYTITYGGDVVIPNAFTISGNFPATINLSNTTNLTWPISGTLLTDAGSYSNPSWITSLSGSKLTGTVTANAITAGSYGINITGNSSTVTTNANMSGDVSSTGNVTTLASVNPNAGSFGDSSHVASFTVNNKGLITASSNVSIAGFTPVSRTRTQLSSPAFNTSYQLSTTKDEEVNITIAFSSVLSINSEVDVQTSIDNSNWTTILKDKKQFTLVSNLLEPMSFTLPVSSYFKIIQSGSGASIDSIFYLDEN